MGKSGKLDMEWYSPQALANRADDGFRFVARSAAKIVRDVPFGVGYGVSKVGCVFFRRRGKTAKRQAKPAAAPPRQDTISEVAGRFLGRKVPSGRTVAAAGRDLGVRSPTAGGQPAARREQVPRPPLDVEELPSEHAPHDRVNTIKLRKALDDLLDGSERVRRSALETLVGQGQAAGPLLAASTRGSSPQVVEAALEGLRQIDWPNLVGSISEVLESSDTELRIIAVRAAGRLPDDRKRPLLERGLRDPNARVRRRTLSYLSWHDSSWAVAEIMRLCHDQEPEVRWAAVEALMTLRPSEAYNHLELMMPSLTPVHQRRAAALLAKREDSTARQSNPETPEEPDGQAPPAPKVSKNGVRTVAKKKAARKGKKVSRSQGGTRKQRPPKRPSRNVKTSKQTR